MPAAPPLDTLDELYEYNNDWVRNDATPAFQGLRLNTLNHEIIRYMETIIVGGGGEPTIAAGTTAQYWRGDKSWQTLNPTAVGLSNVPNINATNAANLSSGLIPAARFGSMTIPISAINATGTADATTILFGNGTWGTYAYSDGDKGDVTISTGGTVITLNDDAVTLNHLPEIDQFRVLGRVAAGIGDVSALTGSQLTTILDIFTSTTAGIVPLSGGGTTNFLRADGTWAAAGGAGTLADGTYDDIVVSSGGTLMTIGALQVTNSKINDVAWTKITGAPSFTVDSTIINGSTNAVEGNAVYDELQLKQDTITTGTTAQYFRGDLSLATFPTISGTNTGDVTKSGETYLSLTGQALTANAVNLSGTHVTGTLAAARFGALTGDVTNSVGNYATTISNGAVSNVKVAAGIDAVKLGDGSVTNTEFQYISTLTSNAQTQLDGKMDFNIVNTMLAPGRIVFPGLATDSQLKVGSFEIQGRSTTSTLIGHNVYFDGTSFTHRLTGPLSFMDINPTATSFLFGMASSATAGSAATVTYSLGVYPTGIIVGIPNGYINFDSTTGSTGYGFRVLTGQVQFKHAGGSWADIGSGGGGSGTINSGSLNRLTYYAGAGTTVSELAPITADRALISDVNGLPVHSSVTAATLAFLDATSSIQTQINTKQATLVSGTSIKTINTISLLGSGDITISGSISDGVKNEITVASSGTDWTVNSDAITTAKILNANVTNAKLANSTIGFGTPGSTGTAPNWSASTTALGATATLNLPLAASGVTSGMISNAAQSIAGPKSLLDLTRSQGYSLRLGTNYHPTELTPATITNGKYNAFGFTDVLPTGEYIIVGKEGTSHTEGTELVLRISFDQGATWTRRVINTWGVAGQGHQGGGGGVSPSGRIIVFFFIYEEATTASIVQQVTYSDDKGVTWSTPATISANSETAYAPFGKLAKIGGGQIMLSWYGITGTTYTSYVIKSSDDGITWGSPVSVISNTTDDITETDFEYLGGNVIIGLGRTENSGENYRQFKSLDNGATWANMGQVSWGGDQTPAWLGTYRGPNGKRVVVAYHRNSTSIQAVYGYASDIIANVSGWDVANIVTIGSVAVGNGYPTAVHPYDEPYGLAWWYNETTPLTVTEIKFATLPLNTSLPLAIPGISGGSSKWSDALTAGIYRNSYVGIGDFSATAPVGEIDVNNPADGVLATYLTGGTGAASVVGTYLVEGRTFASGTYSVFQRFANANTSQIDVDGGTFAVFNTAHDILFSTLNIGFGTGWRKDFRINTTGGTLYAQSLDDATAVAKMVVTTDGILSYQAIPGGGSSQWTTTGSDIYYNTGNVAIGKTSASVLLDMQKNANSSTAVNLTNTTAGASATAYYEAATDAGVIEIGMYSSTTTPFDAIAAGNAFIYSNQSIAIISDDAAGIIKFSVGGSVESFRMSLETSINYINFGTTSGASGYGIRNNAGVPEWKTSGGSWAGFGGGTTINNNANNRIITGSGTASTLEAEANLTWDQSVFIVKTANSGYRFQEYTSGSTYFAMYPDGVTPGGGTFGLLFADDGTEAYLSSSTTTYIYAAGAAQITATTSGIQQPASAYHNWGTTAGSGGYGIRDNAGAMEFKNSGGSWATIATLAGRLTFQDYDSLTTYDNDTLAGAGGLVQDQVYHTATGVLMIKL